MRVEEEKRVRMHNKKKKGKTSSLCYTRSLFFLTHRTAIEVVVVEQEDDDIM